MPPLQPHVILDFDSKGNLINQDNFYRDVYIKGLSYNRGRKNRLPHNEFEETPYYQISSAQSDKEKGKLMWNQHFVLPIYSVNYSL